MDCKKSSGWLAVLIVLTVVGIAGKTDEPTILLAGNLFLKTFAGWEKHSDRLMLAGTEDRLFISHESKLLSKYYLTYVTLLFGREINIFPNIFVNTHVKTFKRSTRRKSMHS